MPQVEWIGALEALLGKEQVISEPRTLRTLSRDAYYYSPILQPVLDSKLADAIAVPKDQEQLAQLIQFASLRKIPITLRGAGTGNYGQCVPLQGGIVVSTHRMNRILEFDQAHGVMRVEPGVRLGQIERVARAAGWELRCYPSTWATATVGGFVSGGFGGVGSIQYGTLWDGFLASLKVMEMSSAASIYSCEGDTAVGLIHAYGTAGIVVELELVLAKATPWEETVFSFGELQTALQFAYQVAQNQQPKRLISLCEWPIPSFFKPLVQARGVAGGRCHVLLELAEGGRQELESQAAHVGAMVEYYTPPSQYHRGKFCISDFSWNHATLWAMKADPSWTYLQTFFDTQPNAAMQQIQQLRDLDGEDVAFHLEYIKQGSQLRLAGLDLIRFHDPHRIRRAVERREQIGVEVMDPHTYYLDSDPRWGGQAVLDAKERFDPQGLLNPGKIQRLASG